jgi:hypothetical protein
MSRKTSKVAAAETASEVANAELIKEVSEAAEADTAAEVATAAAVAAAVAAAEEAADVLVAQEAVAAAEAAEDEAAVAGKFTLSERAAEYLSVLLAQYFGTATAELNADAWLEAVEGGNQVLVRNGPLLLEVTDVPFVVGDASKDLSGGNILINVHRQLADVRLLD